MQETFERQVLTRYARQSFLPKCLVLADTDLWHLTISMLKPKTSRSAAFSSHVLQTKILQYSSSQAISGGNDGFISCFQITNSTLKTLEYQWNKNTIIILLDWGWRLRSHWIKTAGVTQIAAIAVQQADQIATPCSQSIAISSWIFIRVGKKKHASLRFRSALETIKTVLLQQGVDSLIYETRGAKRQFESVCGYGSKI